MFFPAFGAESVVHLPQFTVKDSSLLPKPESWRYVRAAGFEILSNGSDQNARKLIQDLVEFRQAVGVVWPAIDDGRRGQDALILCGSGGKFADFVAGRPWNPDGAQISLALRGPEGAALVINEEASLVDLPPATGNIVDPEGSELSLAGAEGSGLAADPYKELHREYVHFLLGGLEPRPAPWLEEGLAQLLASLEYQRHEIVFGRLPDLSAQLADEQEQAVLYQTELRNNIPSAKLQYTTLPPSGVDTQPGKGFNATFTHGARLLSLDHLFAVKWDSPEARDTVGGLWAKECWAFMHLCLYGEGRRYQKPFLEFVARAQREPVTEDLFKACFHMNYRQMEVALVSYSSFTAYRYYTFKAAEGGGLKIPDIALREATEAEVGRIKGDALALAGQKESAHYTLLAPYVRGSRDPDLMAALGLEELAGGDAAHARPLLESAVAQKTTRARAYVELGKLRLAELVAKPAAPGGKLAPGQLTAVLAPLMAARQLPPALPETFETIAEALLAADVKLSREDLGVVTAGVLLFPSDSELAYRDACLHAAQGYGADAARLARFGAANAADAAARARLVHLAEAIPGG